MSQQAARDHWSSKAYTASASFVPKLTSVIVSWLDPQSSDTILDLGCGDGVLTAQIKAKCSEVVGYDASPNLIATAQSSYATSGLIFDIQDCRYLENSNSLAKNAYDKVFSNAALHWILRDPHTRMTVLRAAYQALRPGGAFVFEMGGAGNVPEVHAALLAAVVHQGLSIQQARDVCPWVFPSEKLMKRMLEDVGFVVERSQLEYRPTELTMEKEGGVEGWVRLMGAQFLEALPPGEKREGAVREVCETLETIISHEEDGSRWLGYVRLRVFARKLKSSSTT
ncbi:hypothetical protein MMC20_004327 [Loxospora ochrophaea]|nr:hypothetical protein [Loxospora ochrophaea]